MPPACAINGGRRATLLALLVAGGGLGASTWLLRDPTAGMPTVGVPVIAELPPMCPWRDPAGDLRAFFPDATGHRSEVRVLSGERARLQARLGRPPSADEHAIYLHRVERNGRGVGTVLVRRVRGDHGAIEIVVAVEPDGRLRGTRLQRMREPEAAARALSPAWLARMSGMTAESDWSSEPLLSGLEGSARVSAAAVMEGVRALLVLLDAAESRGLPGAHH